MSHAIYLALPGFNVYEYRAHAGAYIMGVPQPTVITGLANALSLALSRKHGLATEQTPGVAYGVSEWSGFSGISMHKRQLRAKATENAPLDDRVRASVMLSMIIELVLTDDSSIPTEEQVVEELERLRMMNGSIFNKKAVQVHTELADALACMPREAFFLTDAVAVMAEELQTAPSTAAAMANLISRPKRIAAPTLPAEQPAEAVAYKTRYVPTLVGWRALQAVDAHPLCHPNAAGIALTEPVLGLGQFRNRNAFRAWALNPDSPVFWRHATENVTSLHFVAKGCTPFTPSEFVF